MDKNDSGNLIDALLEEQQALTAVERFSQLHERDYIPAQERYYKNILPSNKPEKGEQYSFEVDLDACTGCKACVTACHSLNGLDEDESWRDVGVLFGGTKIEPRQQTVTTACHHCADPACLNGCPVLAYEKDEETGIVRHLDDQCIGCQYCILKCPYDVPKYNARLGIVRKCDMCIGRLKEGEAPACVQACPTQAIAIRVVKVSDLGIGDEGSRAGKRAGRKDRMLPGAFQSEYTKPSTTFRTKSQLHESMAAADNEDQTPEHEHTPLVFMLVFTQVSIGMMLATWLLQDKPGSFYLTIVGLVIGAIGMMSSVLHLGSPMGAWRSFLGWRRSWLSREVMALGAWFPLAVMHVSIMAADYFSFYDVPELIISATGWGASILGLLGVYCSVMVYVDTRREFWDFRKTSVRFFGSSLAAAAATAVLLGESYLPLVAVMLIKILSEALTLLPAKQKENIYARKSARIQLYPLRKTLLFRFGFALLVILLPLVVSGVGMVISAVLLSVIVLSEIFERKLYFGAVAALRMPGLIPSKNSLS